MKFWYHGTPEYFEKWNPPPVKSKFNQGLHPHPFVCLTRDMALAEGASEGTGGLCRSELKPNARILDLHVHSNDNIEVWKTVRTSKVGMRHLLLRSYNSWLEACRSGYVLRFLTSEHDELGIRLSTLTEIAHSEKYSLEKRRAAYWEVHNFTRQWINTVILPARQYGYHAVICNEIDTRSSLVPKTSQNIHVFNVEMLTDPEWLSVPDISRMK